MPESFDFEHLAAHHLAMLKASGISDEVIADRGYRTVRTQAVAKNLGFAPYQARVPALLVPILAPAGHVAGYQLRPDDPRVRDGKSVKYESLPKQPPRLDVPSAVRSMLGDPNTPLWITEGVKKADSAVSAGLMCLALTGVWGWRGKNESGGSASIGDFDHVAWNGRTVYIAFDSDSVDKPSVRKAEERLAGFLESRGSKVQIVRIPAGASGEKIGLDDYLAGGGSSEVLASNAINLTEKNSHLLISSYSENEKVSKLTSVGDLLNEPEEDVPWVVEGMLPAAGISMLVAKPKVGKSTMARNLALSVARGEDFFGRECKHGYVIYLALEEKRGEVRVHFKSMGAIEGDSIGVHIDSAPEDSEKFLENEITLHSAALAIVDPLFLFLRFKDGNDYAQVTRVLEPLRNIARRTGAHILVTHHMGKRAADAGDSPLGSTALFGGVDTLIEYRKSGDKRVVKTIQRGSGKDLEETVVEFDTDSGRVGSGGSALAVKHAELRREILMALENGALAEADVKKGVRADTGEVQRVLRSMVEAGDVVRTGQGKKGDAYTYQLAKISESETPLVHQLSLAE